MVTATQDFSSSTSLADNFTQSNPASGTFTWANNVGLGGSGGVSVSLGSDQIWTAKQSYTIAGNGTYVLSAFFQSSENAGYGALGFSIQSQDSNTGGYGAPGGSHVGVFFHGGGGGFLNNGPIGIDGQATTNDTPIYWSNGGIASDGSWYQAIFTMTALGADKYDLNIKIYNATSGGVVGSLVTEHTMTDDTNDPQRVGPAITNANIGGANTLQTFFSSEGSRMTAIDNFQIDLSGGALFTPIVDLSSELAGGLNHTGTFSNVTGPIGFTIGNTNLSDLDSVNLSQLIISIPIASIGSGDELYFNMPPPALPVMFNIDSSTSAGQIQFDNTFFSYGIQDNNGIREIYFTSLSGSNGSQQAATKSAYETLLDTLQFNNTSNTPGAIPERVFSVMVKDESGHTSPAATLTIDLHNAELTYDNAAFHESIADDGSINSTKDFQLAGDTFTGTIGSSLGAVTNVPAGLTASLAKTSDSSARLSFSGNATAHTDANDINNLTVTFFNADFSHGNAAGIDNAVINNLGIDFSVAASPGSGSSNTVDGVVVNTATSSGNGVTRIATTIPIISGSRVEDPSTIRSTYADIPLVTDGSNTILLQVSLPIGVGLSSLQVTDSGNTTLRERLIAATELKTTQSLVLNQIIQDAIEPYVTVVEDEGQVNLRTITFSAGNQLPAQPIIVAGGLGNGEGDLGHPLRHEALLIDARNLPEGTELQLDNVEFAIVIGNVRVIGGNGRNYVIGDDAVQFIVLGAGNDVLKGGDGNDTIASKQGDDQLYGDAGNDYVIGGEGNDTLYGGDGDDLLQGGESDAGNWTFSLNNQNQVVSSFTPNESVLSFASDWSSQPMGWFSSNKPVTNDSRVEFVYRDVGNLTSIAALYQAVIHRLPSTEEMNDWSAQNLSAAQLSEIAYQYYLAVHSNVLNQTPEQQVAHLIEQVWGSESVNSDWINAGVNYLNQGGSWGEMLLYMTSHENLRNGLLDSQGNLRLTQNMQTSETGWSSDSGDDILSGGQGNDTLIGGRGHNVLDGGAGTDSVVMIETAGSHHIMLNHAGRISIHRAEVFDMNDLVDIERVVFSDKTLDINASNLNPTTLKNIVALKHLIGDAPLTLAELNQLENSNISAEGFVQELMQTNHYQEHWGVLSNTDFVSELSEVVLGTALTGDNLAYWVNQLDQNAMARNDVLLVAVGVVDYQDALFAGNGLLLV